VDYRRADAIGGRAARSKGAINLHRLSRSLTGQERVRKSDFRFTCSIYNALRGSNI